MKVYAKIENVPFACGGKALLLCDEKGEILDGQISVKVDQTADDITRVTATFALAGFVED